MGEDELLGHDDADNRPHGVEHLREIEAADRARFVADREHVGIASGFQHRAAAGHHEDAGDVDPEALGDARGHVQQGANDVDPEAPQEARAVAAALDQHGGEDGDHRVGAVERHLHVHGRGVGQVEDGLERRDQMVRHVVEEPPQHEAGDEHAENGQIFARYHFRWRGSICRRDWRLRRHAGSRSGGAWPRTRRARPEAPGSRPAPCRGRSRGCGSGKAKCSTYRR